MAEIIQRERAVRVKIVYYGPALGGKTTNLRMLHGRAIGTRRGEMISVNSHQDRTMLFDLLPMNTVGPHGYDIRLQVVAVPGQVLYAATRRAALKGADAVVFVANSAADRREENERSYRELVAHLIDQGIDPSTIPLALQYNKRDLPQVMSLADMDASLRKRAQPANPAVAGRGEGVIETFEAILERTLGDLARRYRVLAMKDEGPKEWAQRAVTTLFGPTAQQLAASSRALPGATGELGIPVEFELDGQICEGSPGSRTIRVPTMAVSEMGLDPAAEALAAEGDSVGQAAAELASALGHVTAQRDRAWKRLADVRRAVRLAAELPTIEPKTRAARVLAWLSQLTSAARASFVFLSGAAHGRALSLPPHSPDPLLSGPAGQRFVRVLAEGFAPRLIECANELALADLLAAESPQPAALVSLPVATSRARVGLLLLQFAEGAGLPDDDELRHLSLLASLFAIPLQAESPTTERPEDGARPGQAPFGAGASARTHASGQAG